MAESDLDKYVSQREFTEFRKEIRNDFSMVLERIERLGGPTDLKGLFTAMFTGLGLVAVFGTMAFRPFDERLSISEQALLRNTEIQRQQARWEGRIEERLTITRDALDSLEASRTAVSDEIAASVRDRVLLNGFSEKDGERLLQELRRLQNRVTEIDRRGTAAYQSSQELLIPDEE